MQHFDKAGLRACASAAAVAILALGLPSGALAQGAAQEAPAADALRVNVNEYIVRGNTVLDAVAIEKAVYPFLGPDRSLTDIEGARDALQAAYHERGYQSVYVDLPEQQVNAGVVILQVAETKVGRVRVVGAQHYSPLAIRDDVPALQEGKVPDFNQAQTELAGLNQTASRQVMPLVREGKIPGTMDIDLKVEDKSPWTASFGLNNDYSADTKRLRATGTLGYDNLWQRGHAFSLTFFTAPQDTDNAKVWSASYTLPLAERWSLMFSGYQSDSNVATIGGTNVLGKGHSFGATVTYTLAPQGAWHNSFSFGIDYKDFDEALEFGGTSDTVPLKYVPFTFGYNGYRYTEEAQSSVGFSVVTATRSFFDIGSGSNEFDYKRYRANPSFAVFKGDATHLHSLPRDWQLFGRTGFQIASGPLVSNEQFSAGGASSIRGYLAAERSADDGLMASIELRTPSFAQWLGPKVNEWRAYTFAEWATLRLRDPLPEQDSSFDLASVGFGTRLQMLDWLTGSLDWGYPLKEGANTKRHDPRLYFNLRASF